MTSINESLDSVNLCPTLCWILCSSPFMTMHTLPRPLHEYACTLNLKLPQFCSSRRHCLGKDSQCSPYLLQVINSFLLIFSLVVSFGSTLTKRWAQFGGNTSTDYSTSPSITPQLNGELVSSKHKPMCLMLSEAKQTKTSEVCTEQGLLQGHTRMCDSCPPKPQTPWRVSARPFQGQVREGGSRVCDQLLHDSLIGWFWDNRAVNIINP